MPHIYIIIFYREKMGRWEENKIYINIFILRMYEAHCNKIDHMYIDVCRNAMKYSTQFTRTFTYDCRNQRR